MLWASFTKEQFNNTEPGAHESEGQLDFVTIHTVATNFEAILSNLPFLSNEDMVQFVKTGSFLLETVWAFMVFFGCDTLPFKS